MGYIQEFVIGYFMLAIPRKALCCPVHVEPSNLPYRALTLDCSLVLHTFLHLLVHPLLCSNVDLKQQHTPLSSNKQNIHVKKCYCLLLFSFLIFDITPINKVAKCKRMKPGTNSSCLHVHETL